MGFNCEDFFFTVAHAPGPGLSFPENDIRVTSPVAGGRLHAGPGDPDHFFDRRGVRHKITIVRTEKLSWLVKNEFFSGESGLPVFNSRNSVCGVVYGNRLDPAPMGLVSRLDKLETSGGVLLFPRGTFVRPQDMASGTRQDALSATGGNRNPKASPSPATNPVIVAPRIEIVPQIRK